MNGLSHAAIASATGSAPVPLRFCVAFGPSSVEKKQSIQHADELLEASGPQPAKQPRRSAFSPFDTRDRRHKSSNPTSDAGKKAAESPEEFQKRDPASTSFESIDRRSF